MSLSSMKNMTQSIYDEEAVYDSFVKIHKAGNASSSTNLNCLKEKKNIKELRSFSSANNALEKSANNEPKSEYVYRKGLVPNTKALDKDKMYVENIGLKQQINEMKTQITILKSRNEQLEQELSGFKAALCENHCNSSSSEKKYMNLATSLKETVKAASETMKLKDSEIEKLKKNRKNCQIKELEQELKGYQDECFRLKCLINTLSVEKNNTYEAKVQEQVEQIKVLQKERIEILRNLDNIREENLNQKETIYLLNKQQDPKKKKSLIKELEGANKDLKAKLSDFLVEFLEKEDSYKKEIGYLRRKIEEEDSLIEKQNNQISQLIYNKQEKKNLNEIELNMITQHHFSIFPKRKVDRALSSNIVRKQEKHLETFFKSAPKNYSAAVSDQDFQDIVLHIKLSLQVKNLKKTALPNIIFGKGFGEDQAFDKVQLASTFSKSVFICFKDESLYERLLEFCNSFIIPSHPKPIDSTNKSSIKYIKHKLLKLLPTWKTFTLDEEAVLLKSLETKFGRITESFNNICLEHDESNSGFISQDEFRIILDKMCIDTSERELEYIWIKLYSFYRVINKVVYRNINTLFDKKLFTPNSVKKCIEEISKCLSMDNISFESVFKVELGLITKENFETGLDKLKLKSKYQDKIQKIIDTIGPKIFIESGKLKTAIYNFYFEELNHIKKLLFSSRSILPEHDNPKDTTENRKITEISIKNSIVFKQQPPNLKESDKKYLEVLPSKPIPKGIHENEHLQNSSNHSEEILENNTQLPHIPLSDSVKNYSPKNSFSSSVKDIFVLGDISQPDLSMNIYPLPKHLIANTKENSPTLEIDLPKSDNHITTQSTNIFHESSPNKLDDSLDTYLLTKEEQKNEKVNLPSNEKPQTKPFSRLMTTVAEAPEHKKILLKSLTLKTVNNPPESHSLHTVIKESSSEKYESDQTIVEKNSPKSNPSENQENILPMDKIEHTVDAESDPSEVHYDFEEEPILFSDAHDSIYHNPSSQSQITRNLTLGYKEKAFQRSSTNENIKHFPYHASLSIKKNTANNTIEEENEIAVVEDSLLSSESNKSSIVISKDMFPSWKKESFESSMNRSMENSIYEKNKNVHSHNISNYKGILEEEKIEDEDVIVPWKSESSVAFTGNELKLSKNNKVKVFKISIRGDKH